jgi:MFS family permease
MLIAGPDRPERRSDAPSFLVMWDGPQSAWAPLVPYAKARVHANDQQFGLLLLCFGAGSILSMPTMGSLASRHGCKLLTQIAACSIFVGLVGSLRNTDHRVR